LGFLYKSDAPNRLDRVEPVIRQGAGSLGKQPYTLIVMQRLHADPGLLGNRADAQFGFHGDNLAEILFTER
jgi:hypothetical protein